MLSADGGSWMQDSMNPSEIEQETVLTITDFVPTVVKDQVGTIFLPGMAWRGLDAVEPLEQQ